jgi:hypothetical protein
VGRNDGVVPRSHPRRHSAVASHPHATAGLTQKSWQVGYGGHLECRQVEVAEAFRSRTAAAPSRPSASLPLLVQEMSSGDEGLKSSLLADSSRVVPLPRPLPVASQLDQSLHPLPPSTASSVGLQVRSIQGLADDSCEKGNTQACPQNQVSSRGLAAATVEAAVHPVRSHPITRGWDGTPTARNAAYQQSAIINPVSVTSSSSNKHVKNANKFHFNSCSLLCERPPPRLCPAARSWTQSGWGGCPAR